MTREELNKAKQQMADTGAVSPLQIQALIAEAEESHRLRVLLDQVVIAAAAGMSRLREQLQAKGAK